MTGELNHFFTSLPGYGHVAPKTKEGRLVTIVYAIVGIPLTFLYLSNIGNFMAECFRLFYKKICCGICVYCCQGHERSSSLGMAYSRRVTVDMSESTNKQRVELAVHDNCAFDEQEVDIKETGGDDFLTEANNDQVTMSSFNIAPQVQSQYVDSGKIDVNNCSVDVDGTSSNEGDICGDSIDKSANQDGREDGIINLQEMGKKEIKTDDVDVKICCLKGEPEPISTSKLVSHSTAAIVQFDLRDRKSNLQKDKISFVLADVSENASNFQTSYIHDVNINDNQIFVENETNEEQIKTIQRVKHSKTIEINKEKRKALAESKKIEVENFKQKQSILLVRSADDILHQEAHINDEMQTDKVTVPISICLIIISMYIFGGAVLFTYWEEWDLLTGSYFCFVTLSTIGFGDIVPGTDMKDWASHSKLVLCALWLALGLSLLAMCFNLMQEEVKEKCIWIGHKLGILKECE